MAQITDLPVELLILIFSFLEDTSEEPSQSICMMVCRQWYEIILDMASLPGNRPANQKPSPFDYERLPLLFTRRQFQSFIHNLFKSLPLLEWSQILELPEKYQLVSARDKREFWECCNYNYFDDASYLAGRNVDVLRYVIDVKGCPVDKDAVALAIFRHDTDMLQYFILRPHEREDHEGEDHEEDLSAKIAILSVAKERPYLMEYLRNSGLLAYFPSRLLSN